jgi:methyl-accepting chemotaxis protein
MKRGKAEKVRSDAMKWFGNLPTRSKLVLSFGVMIVFLIAVIATAYNGLQSYRRDADTTLALTTAENNLHSQRAALLTMMLVTDRAQRDDLKAQIAQTSRDNDEILHRVSENASYGALFNAKLEALMQVRAAFKKTRDEQVVPLIYAGKIDLARQMAMGEQRRLFSEIEVLDDGLKSIAQQESLRKINANTIIYLAAAVGALLVGLLLVGLLNRLIALPLQEISNVAERIAAGDLAVDLSEMSASGRRDEVGVLAQTFSHMRHSLGQTAGVAGKLAASDLRVKVTPQSGKDVLGNSFAQMVENLRRQTRETGEAATVLGSVVTQMSASTTELAASAAQTASAVTQTTATVEEIRQTAHVSSDKARLVAENAQNASRTAQNGRHATEETSRGMERIREQMEAIGDSMIRLSEQSSAIAQIITSVDDLAQQSNLLAVNAAIEAAKAGEQGKGFAVVAQEVKSLADQSKQSTTQVRTILSDIQKATAAAVMATEQGNKAVEAGVQQASQAGESIQALSQSIDLAAQSATQIAASSQQQLIGMDQMTVAMESIKQASMGNVEGARQLEDAARNLQDLGTRLQELVGRYQVE